LAKSRGGAAEGNARTGRKVKGHPDREGIEEGSIREGGILEEERRQSKIEKNQQQRGESLYGGKNCDEPHLKPKTAGAWTRT